MATELSNDTDNEVSDTLLERLRQATAGTYDIAGILGRGGMAVVFVGEDLRLRRTVAIKVMEPSLSLIPGMAERFLEEARTLARLQHPNVIVVHDVQRSRGLNFFVMTLIEGGGVDELCHRTSPLPIDQAQWILLGASRALAFAHSERIVHRDVKPANILVNVKGDVILTDFGIAKGVDGTGLTKSGTQIGTPVYMSPEQFTGESVGPASDQYALGITAYQLLTGAPPFSGELYALIAAHGTRAPVPIRQLRPDCPAYLANAVMRMLAKMPEERWPSLDDLSEVFGANLPNDGGVARRNLATAARALNLERRQAVDALTAQPPLSPVPTNASRTAKIPALIRLVTVSPPRATIFVGGTLDLRATVTAENGEPVTDITPSWSSSEPGSVTVDATGRLLGVAPGSATVRAFVDGGSSEAQITIEAAPIARLSLPTPVLTMRVGDRAEPPVSAIDVTGSTRTDVTLNWLSRATQVVDLETSGVMRALRPGKAVVEISYGNLRQLIDVTVLRRPIARVSIRRTESRLELGATRLLTIDAFDDRGDPATASDLRWRSSAPSVIHIDSSGHALAIGQGVAQISVEVDEATDTLELTAVESPAAVIELMLDRAAIEVDDEIAVRLKVTDTTGGIRSAESVRVWSSDPSVASVDEARMVISSFAPGAISIYAQSIVDGVPGVSTTVPFVVRAPATTRLDVEPSQVELEQGASQSISVRAFDRRGRAVSDALVSWASETPAVLRIGNDGIVHGLSVGSGMVSARVLNPGGSVVETRIPILVRPSPAAVPLASANTIAPTLVIEAPAQEEVSSPPPLREPMLTPRAALPVAEPIPLLVTPSAVTPAPVNTPAADRVVRPAAPVASTAVPAPAPSTTQPAAARKVPRIVIIGAGAASIAAAAWFAMNRTPSASDEAAVAPKVVTAAPSDAPPNARPSVPNVSGASVPPQQGGATKAPVGNADRPTSSGTTPVEKSPSTPPVQNTQGQTTRQKGAVVTSPVNPFGVTVDPPAPSPAPPAPITQPTRDQKQPDPTPSPPAVLSPQGNTADANTKRAEAARAVERPDAGDLRAQADRFVERLRSGGERNAELAAFFTDGAGHKVELLGAPTMVGETAGRIDAQFEVRLVKFDGGGRRTTRLATVSIQVVKRDGNAVTASTSVGPLRPPR